ncbi:MAG TPA: hypothetical protein VGD69_02355 [Herpetosiphonaceae bacterium]
MTRYSFLRRGLRSEQGSSVAQAAAVALVAAALIGVIVAMSPRLSSATEHAFTCLVASLSGGGGACGGGGSAALGGSSQDSPPVPDNCDGWCQVSEFGKELFINTPLGLLETILDVGKYALGDQETRAQYDELGRLFEEDPLGTTGLVLGSIIDPIVEDVKAGHYGKATGSALGNIVGGKGTGSVGKLGKLGKIDDVASGVARSGDEVADAAAMPTRFSRKDAGYKTPELEDKNCTYCQKPLTQEPRLRNSIEADHLVSLKQAWEGAGKHWTADEWKRFSNDAENLVASCKSCNASKQAKKLFDEWAPPNMTPEAQAQLKQRIQSIIEKYKLDNP